MNKITKKNRYPLPLIHELFDRVRGATIFTRLDLKGAYNLVRMRPGDEWLTAFRTRYGHYEYCVMPFGLTNAPATFQTLINDVLRPYLDVFCVAYLDDILIFSKNLSDHIPHVKAVLSALLTSGLFLNGEKCIFHAPSVSFLGYIIAENGFTMDPEKVACISNWPLPKNLKDVQSFLGFCNFYRRFISDYSNISYPLTNLMRKDTLFNFTSSCTKAFETLRSSFLEAPVLAHFDAALPITLECDASDYALGAVISQTQSDGTLRPVAFYGRKFTAPELNYDVFDKEMLAIVTAMGEWRCYLEGSRLPFSILTDHKNIKYFTTSRALNRRQARWAEFLAGFDFCLQFRPGLLNGRADAISRRPDFNTKGGDSPAAKHSLTLISPRVDVPTSILQSTMTPGSLTDTPRSSAFAVVPSRQTSTSMTDLSLPEQIRISQLTDSTLMPIIESLTTDPSSPYARQGYAYPAEGPLVFQSRLCVPNEANIKLAILAECHDDSVSGHFGRHKTIELVARRFHWRGPHSFVIKYVATCLPCQRSKTPRHKPHGLLQPLPVPTRPWSSISIDFIVKLPKSNGCDSILVIVDRMTKLAHFIGCNESMQAPDLANLFLRNVFRAHGLPLDIVSDRGPLFVSKFWQATLAALKVKSNLSTAYHPQTDGQTERVNAALEQYLRVYENYQQTNWNSFYVLQSLPIITLRTHQLE